MPEKKDKHEKEKGKKNTNSTKIYTHRTRREEENI